MTRRTFLAATAASAFAAIPDVRFGLDLFSIRSEPWDAFQFLDYAAAHQVKVVHFSEIRFIGSLDDEHLKRVRAHAEKLGIQVEIGMRSICPTSKSFDAKLGTPQQQIEKMLHAAQVVGSPFVRCFLGTFEDRKSPGGIDRHIEKTVQVLRSVRPQVMDSGLKLAIETTQATCRRAR